MAAKVRRHIPSSPTISSPYDPTTMAQVGFLKSRHLQPERLPSGKKETIVSLRLIDVSTNAISNVQMLSATIKRLNASSLQLKTVPEDLIRSLLCLTKLDLTNNSLGDTSFPDCMSTLKQLLDVRLASNTLTKVPACIRKLKVLKRLDLSNNQLVSCSGLEKLKRLQILVLDNNKLTSVFLEISTLRKLEVVRCSSNKLREISRDIRDMTALVDVDVSQNCIIMLPADIFLLPKLDVLVACQNEVTKVPTFNMRPQNKRCMSHIDLSDNKLTKFPGHLLMMTSKLDLSNNKIRTLSYHVIKKLEMTSGQQLIIKNNPLSYPPSDICDSGLKCIASFFQESQSEVKVYQGVKVLVLGHHRSGKTSFVQTLVDQQPRLSEEVQDISGGIDIYSMTFDMEEGTQDFATGKSLELSIWDLCGHPFYMHPHYTFFEQPSVAVLTFNLFEYSDANFKESIGCWLDWMIAKTNKLVIVLVGTHCDKLTVSQMSKVSRDVRRKVTMYLDHQSEFIKQQIKVIEERPHISPTLSDQLKTFMRLLQTKITVYTEVICTSAKMFVGFDKVRLAIENFVGDRQLFPNVMRVIPTFWLDVRHFVEDRGNTMTFPVMTWDTFEKEVTSRFGMKQLIRSIAQYLHEIGEVVWFSNIQTLKGLVFIRPSWLFDVLRLMLRHDMENATFSPDENIRSTGLTTMKFDRLKNEAMSSGILDRDLVKCLLSPLISHDNSSVTTDAMKLFTEGFELGYFITNRQTVPVNQSISSKGLQDTKKLTHILVPWLVKTSEPEEFSSLFFTLKDKRKLVCCYQFPLYLPPGLFEVMCVRAHNEKHKLQLLHQWGEGLHCLHLHDKIHVIMTYFKNSKGESERTDVILKFEVIDENLDRVEETPASTMWSILLPLLLDFEQLLASYSGILVKRLTECPKCQTASFIGEWLTPKDAQALASRSCEACKQEIDSAYLVQPKEQKRVIIKRNNQVTTESSRPPSSLPKLSPVQEEESNRETFIGLSRS